MRQVLRRCGRLTHLVAAAAISVVVVATSGPADAAGAAVDSGVATTITAAEWHLYTSRFVTAEGRVVDVEKHGVSHSEGQGYGLMLAVRADDQATFDRILRFTFDNMRGRGDGLISWVWNPASFPHVTDSNNASDGDVLIAYALVTAAVKWNDARYIAVADPMIDAIGDTLLDERDGVVRLKPAAFGFDENHPDGPVVNLSYYIYGAFLLFEAVDDDHPWLEAWQSGLQLTEAATTADGFVPDWITLRSDRFLQPANGFAKKSSYDAVRIPLYMALGGRVPSRYFEPFDRTWNLAGRNAPQDFDLGGRRNLMDMNEPGYRAIAAVAGCAARGEPMPRDLQQFRLQRYFASSLHLLALSAVRANYPECLDDRMMLAGADDTMFAGHN